MSVRATVRKTSAGFTLVELVVSMIVISIAALAVAHSLSIGVGHSADSLLHEKSISLAQTYLDEIRAVRYAESSPVGGVPPCNPCGALGPEGESRAQFDDVDDYHNLADAPPRDRQGQLIAGFERYRVNVVVSYASAAQITAWGLDAGSDAKLVEVNVTTPGGQRYTFPGIRGNY